MLKTLWAVAKFNIFMFAFFLILSLTGWIYTRSEPNIWGYVLVFAWFYGNIHLVLQNRQKIKSSAIDASLDTAAATLDFKEALKERIEERRQARKKNNETVR